METTINYLEQLIKASDIYKSNVCFGQDPVLASLAKGYASAGINGFVLQMEELIAFMKEQKVFPGAFKPNYGFYTVHDRPLEFDFRGSIALARTINLIRKELPGMPVIMDPKTGDINKSSANYAETFFKGWGVNAMTVAPYMGSDSMLPFAEWCIKNRGVYILNLTSNPGSKDFQMLETKEKNRLYINVSDWIRNNSFKYPGLGAVIGAPNTDELCNILTFFLNTGAWIAPLIPGVGGQGGSFEEVCGVIKNTGYDKRIVRINLSSGLTHPWGEKPAPDDWKKIIVDNLFNYNKVGEFA